MRLYAFLKLDCGFSPISWWRNRTTQMLLSGCSYLIQPQPWCWKSLVLSRLWFLLVNLPDLSIGKCEGKKNQKKLESTELNQFYSFFFNYCILLSCHRCMVVDCCCGVVLVLCSIFVSMCSTYFAGVDITQDMDWKLPLLL